MKKNKNNKTKKKRKYSPPVFERYNIDELSEDWSLEAMGQEGSIIPE